ncbi:MAG: hypothetical protein M1352_02585 [Patescibacteria group bacterium]|nr:hypothetical protein [Patescibacteria group bacterium]
MYLSLRYFKPLGLLATFCVILLATQRLAFGAPVPLINIQSPTDGQVINSYVVTLNFSLKNFTLKDYRQFLGNNPNQGHLDLWLDADNPTHDNAIKYAKTDPYVFADVPSGKHTLIVELVGNDDKSFDPQIIQTIKFETRAPAGSEETQKVSPGTITPSIPASGQTNAASLLISRLSSFSGPTKYFVLGGFFLFLGIAGFVILRR